MIDWTDPALKQLDQACNYIRASNSEAVAASVAEHVFSTIEVLDTFPMLGRGGRVAGTRELVIPKSPFLVTYAIDKKRIAILALYHGAQRWPGKI